MSALAVDAVSLDISTLFAAIASASLLLAISLAFIGHRRHPDLMIWAAALLLQAGGYWLYGLRGQISDLASIVLANVFVVASIALYGEGLYAFQHRRPPRRVLWAPVVVIVLFYPFLLDDMQSRVVLSAVAMGLQAGLIAMLLIQRMRITAGRGQYIMLTGVALFALIMVLRAAAVLSGASPIHTITDATTIQSITYLAAHSATLLLSMGLVLMIHERSEAALVQSVRLQQFRTHILECLARRDSLQTILDEIVGGVEAWFAGVRCGIVLPTKSGQPLVERGTDSLRPLVERMLACRPVPVAAAGGDDASPAIWTDLQLSPSGAGWALDIRSSGTQVQACMVLWQALPRGPDAAETFMLTQTALLASVAIERSVAADQLSASERRYRLLVESANEGILVTQSGRVCYANPKLQELVGYRAEDLSGRRALDFVYADDRAAVQRYFAAQRPSADCSPGFRILTLEQGLRWFELTATAFDWEGEPALLHFIDDITERRQADERIRQMAYRDALTQLPNRRLLCERLEEAVADHRRDQQFGALMFMDMDNFKWLNDSYGHDVGDLLLIEVAQRLRRSVGEADTVARFGGDEFVVLLPSLCTEPAAARGVAQQVAEQLLGALAAPYRLRVHHEGRSDLIVDHSGSVSVGVLMFRTPIGDADDLIKQADEAMYQVKQSGRNGIRICEQYAAEV